MPRANFSSTSAGESRVNTPYHQMETLGQGRGALMHPYSPRVGRPTNPLGQAPGPGFGVEVLGAGVVRVWESPCWEVATFPSAPGPRPICSRLVGVPGQQMLPAWQAEGGEGYDRNFSSEAGLVPEQGLGRAGPLWACVLNKGQGVWVHWCSWVPS